MTIGFIIGAIFASVVVIFIGLMMNLYCSNKWYHPVGLVIVGIVLACLWGFGIFYFGHTESGKRALKNQNSELNGGIEREVNVYDVEGDLIQSYRGKFDIEYENERILFDDENGNRHIIYFKTGTIIVNEM